MLWPEGCNDIVSSTLQLCMTITNDTFTDWCVEKPERLKELHLYNPSGKTATSGYDSIVQGNFSLLQYIKDNSICGET